MILTTSFFLKFEVVVLLLIVNICQRKYTLSLGILDDACLALKHFPL